MYETCFGKDAVIEDFVMIYGNLGLIYEHEQKEDATIMFRKSLFIARELYGELKANIDVANCLSNLAGTLVNEGKYEEGVLMFTNAEQIMYYSILAS